MSFAEILLRIVADGFVVPVVLIGMVVILRLPSGARYEAITRGIATGMAALFFAGVIGLLYQDGQRPFEALGVAPGAAFLNNPGFPSDHSLLVFTISFVVWGATKNRTAGAVLFGLSIAVALGRVLALVHTPADVLGGFACALVAALLFYGRSLFKFNTTT